MNLSTWEILENLW